MQVNNSISVELAGLTVLAVEWADPERIWRVGRQAGAGKVPATAEHTWNADLCQFTPVQHQRHSSGAFPTLSQVFLNGAWVTPNLIGGTGEKRWWWSPAERAPHSGQAHRRCHSMELMWGQEQKPKTGRSRLEGPKEKLDTLDSSEHHFTEGLDTC